MEHAHKQLRKFFTMLAVAAALLALIFWHNGAGTDLPSSTAAPIPFALINQDDRTVTNEDFHGHPMMIEFGYTTCPDLCPAQLELMRAALLQLGRKGQDIVPVFVTLDPARDTPGRLKAYLQPYNPNGGTNFVGLTGNETALDALAKAYGIYYEKVADASAPGGYRLDHGISILLVDSGGHLVQSLTQPSPAELADAAAHL